MIISIVFWKTPFEKEFKNFKKIGIDGYFPRVHMWACTHICMYLYLIYMYTHIFNQHYFFTVYLGH